MVVASYAPIFVPATRPERFSKAALSGADAVILDLEDAVAAEDKSTARAALSRDFTDLPVIIRINPSGTQWHDLDVSAVVQGAFAAVMLPKAEDVVDVAKVITRLNGVSVIALIETVKGLANARKIAALDGVVRLAFGSIDYCADLGCAHQQDILLSARSEIVLASRLAEIAAPIDGVTVQLDDPAFTRMDAKHAKQLGMGGKLCIHPKQVAGVINAFLPTQVEIDWAKRVLAAGEGGAVSLDGQMVDEPVRIRARAILNTIDKH